MGGGAEDAIEYWTKQRDIKQIFGAVVRVHSNLGHRMPEEKKQHTELFSWF